ncbi:penicillin-binding protein [bacterium]|nr:penicillin-binding protein [bacterium]
MVRHFFNQGKHHVARHIRRGPRHIIRSLFLGIGASIVFFAGITAAWALFISIPSIDNFQNRRVAESTKIYDRTGTVLLYDVHGTMRRTAVPLSEIAESAKHASIAIEDATFYEHAGVRPLAFLRAVWVNLTTGGYTQGGSTITQQVVKNTLLTQDKNITRKIKEIILALKLERTYTKDQILETYLNEIPYGGTIYGIEEASQYFFGIAAKDLSVAQSAYLAALPQAPTRYSPYGSHRDELEKRKNLVLSRMRELGSLTGAEYEKALAEKVTFNEESDSGIKAPHFVFFVREYLETKYGADAVSNGGLQVITTIDYDLQKEAEEVVRRNALQNEKNFNAENAGLVAVNPKTGQILTMVGSRGYFDDGIDGKFNIATAYRQPGSAFKPFVYATAFEKGYTPDTMLFDLKTQFSSLCAPNDFSDEPPCYSPENYDGKWAGPMSMRDALAQSKNIPAVKTLFLAGIKDSLTMASTMGITTLTNASRYGLTLVLGGGEVTLLDMVGAYSVFANEGIKNPVTPIISVKDRSGSTLEEYKPDPTRVINTEVARQISDVLADNEARTPEFGATSPLYFPGLHVAAKTGTTNDYRDVWIIGYTPELAVGAWAGNNNNIPMVKKIAAFIIAPMWHEFFEFAMKKYPPTDFAPPSPDPDVAQLPPVLRGNWNTDPSKGVHEILYWVDASNPRAGSMGASWREEQFARWDYPVALWASENPIAIPGAQTNVPPPVSAKPHFKIAFPQNGTAVSRGQLLTVQVRHPNPETVTRVAFYINGTFLGASNREPFSLSYMPNATGQATVRAVAESNFGAEEDTVVFSIQ